MRKKGFTLIELIVVVAIVAILATIIMVSYSNVQAKSRDSRRISDVNAIAGAVKMYYIDHKEYPKVDVTCYSRVRSRHNARWNTILTGLIGPYMASVPIASDPSNIVTDTPDVPIWQDNTDNFFYTYGATTVSYVVAARTEVVASGNHAKLGYAFIKSPNPGINALKDCKNNSSPIPGSLESETFGTVSQSDKYGYYFMGENLTN